MNGFVWLASGDDETYELEEGEWIPDDPRDITYFSENISDEGSIAGIFTIDCLVFKA